MLKQLAATGALAGAFVAVSPAAQLLADTRTPTASALPARSVPTARSLPSARSVPGLIEFAPAAGGGLCVHLHLLLIELDLGLVLGPADCQRSGAPIIAPARPFVPIYRPAPATRARRTWRPAPARVWHPTAARQAGHHRRAAPVRPGQPHLPSAIAPVAVAQPAPAGAVPPRPAAAIPAPVAPAPAPQPPAPAAVPPGPAPPPAAAAPPAAAVPPLAPAPPAAAPSAAAPPAAAGPAPPAALPPPPAPSAAVPPVSAPVSSATAQAPPTAPSPQASAPALAPPADPLLAGPPVLPGAPALSAVNRTVRVPLQTPDLSTQQKVVLGGVALVSAVLAGFGVPSPGPSDN